MTRLCRETRISRSVFYRRYSPYQVAKQQNDAKSMENALIDHRRDSRRALTDEQEHTLVASIDNSNSAQIAVNWNDVRLQAKQLHNDSHKYALRDVTNFRASHGFIEGLKKRHSLTTRTANPVTQHKDKRLQQNSWPTANQRLYVYLMPIYSI